MLFKIKAPVFSSAAFIGYLIYAALLLGSNTSAHALGLDIFSNTSSYTLTLNSSESESARKALEEELNNRLKENLRYQPKLKTMPARRRVKEEVEVLEKTLTSMGYYSGEVNYRIFHGQAEDDNATIEYSVDSGAQYKVSKIAFNFPKHVAKPSNIPLQTGDAVKAQSVLGAQAFIENYINDNYCLYEINLSYNVTLHASKAGADIVFTLQQSPDALFGEISFKGQTSIKLDYLTRQAKLEPGTCFKRKQVDETRLQLLQSNLLVSVDYKYDLNPSYNPDVPSKVDITFHLNERHHRTVKTGLNYSTDGGLGMQVGWEHRNLFGSAENLSLDTGFNEISRFATGRYILPRFIIDNQDLTLRSHFERETTDAYDSTRAEGSGIVARQLGDHTSAEVGLALTYADIVEAEQSETYNLISIPVGFTYDYRNSLLNATRGWMFNTSLTPFADISKQDTRFMRWTATTSVYASKTDWAMSPTVALRVSTGSISGAALNDVPADQRFYVGGGGSVRGYSYQSLGELTESEPDGGKSFGEVSAELRTRFAGNWGLVLFLDGGYAYASEAPAFGHDFLWGAGLGLRYHTSFAPIRVDFGFPLDKREGIDDSFQLYISIGQAF